MEKEKKKKDVFSKVGRWFKKKLATNEDEEMDSKPKKEPTPKPSAKSGGSKLPDPPKFNDKLKEITFPPTPPKINVPAPAMPKSWSNCYGSKAAPE